MAYYIPSKEEGRKRLSNETIAQVVEYFKTSKNILQTAVKFGINRNTVRRWVKNYEEGEWEPVGATEPVITRKPYFNPPSPPIFKPVNKVEDVSPPPPTCASCGEREGTPRVIDGKTVYTYCQPCLDQARKDSESGLTSGPS